MAEVENILSVQNILGEGPLWNIEEQSLYWVDLRSDTIHRFWPSTQTHEVFNMEIRVGSLAFRASGGLVLATSNGFNYWDPKTNKLDFIANPEAGKKGSTFNDGKVDRQGRFWAGTVVIGEKKPQNALYRLDPNGDVHTMITGVTISNGIGWSPDNKTMYFVDSWQYLIYAYDFELDTGAISNKRCFVKVPEEGGFPVPDGLTVDSEGYVWCALFGGFRVVRYDPSGKINMEIRLPVSHPTSCIFGGENLNELYITTARLTNEQHQSHPLAGNLFRVKTNVQGLPEPRFGG